MSIEAMRHGNGRKRMRAPKTGTRLSDAVKAVILLGVTFLEGWVTGFAATHSRVPDLSGTPQWMITGSLVLAIVLPILTIMALLKWGDGDESE